MDVAAMIGSTRKPPKLSDCEFYEHYLSDPISAADTLTYYGQMRDYVKHEDDLINSRLTWSLTIYAFLFTTYGILVGSIFDTVRDLHRQPGLPSHVEYVLSDLRVLLSLQIPVVFVGWIVSFFSGVGIVAAHKALEHLKVIADESFVQMARKQIISTEPTECRMLLPRISGGGKPRRAEARLYYLMLPRLIFLAWAALAVFTFYLLRFPDLLLR
jgi:uncharacterized protein with PQ loop repeat